MESYYPLSPRDIGYSSKIEKRTYDPKKAKEVLEKNGYTLEKGKLMYGGKQVIQSIVTGDSFEMKKTAEILDYDLRSLGIKTSIVNAPMATLQKEYLRPRNFDILIIGQNIGINPDLYGVWHSSQASDPGINLSGFKDRKVDKYLEQVRKTTDQAEIQTKLEEVQKVIAEEVPAVFLYSPEYLFCAFSKLKGVEATRISQPDDRFANIASWYMMYDRVKIDTK
jgi:peptide/nickel transport system substrate-binding protein